MPLFEVFISPGYHSSEIEAFDEEEAKRIFVRRIVENLDVEHIDATEIEE
jgi:hypothetical protein